MATEVTKADPSPFGMGPARNNERWGRARVLGLAVRAGLWTLAAVLLGLNAWWAWREIRPVADLVTVSKWITQGRAGEAERALLETLRRSPHDGEARMLFARILAQRGDSLGCARALRLVPFWWPDKPKMLFLEGQALKSIDRRSEAEVAWKELTAMDPLHPMPDEFVSKAVLELMELYALEERWDEAHALIWRVYDQSEPADRPPLLIMRMRTEVERVMPSRAAEQLRRFLKAVPGDWDARRALARAEYAADHKQEAIRLILQCIDERPDDPRGWREYLTMLYEQGDQEGLRATLAKAPEATAGDPEILRFKASALEKQADWTGAAELYRRMVDKQPFNPDYLYRLATVEQRLGFVDLARTHRDRSRVVRTARADLTTAFQKYLDVSRVPQPDPHELAAAVGRLSTLCEALGWPREAQAWARLAPPE
jgi:tetratricopeptide (TPR) repeat protein